MIITQIENTDMSSNALEKFGKALMSEVRDQALAEAKSMIFGRSKAPSDQEIMSQIALPESTRKFVADTLAPEIVDSVLHSLLAMLDWHEDFRLEVEESPENWTNIQSESGQLTAELFTEEGWLSQYSKYPNNFN